MEASRALNTEGAEEARFQAPKWGAIDLGKHPSNICWSIMSMPFFLGPRDWSPRAEKGLERLKNLKAMLPECLLVPISIILFNSNLPFLKEIVLKGLGFVVQLRYPAYRLELVYLCPFDGEIIMTEFMKDAFHQLKLGFED